MLLVATPARGQKGEADGDSEVVARHVEEARAAVKRDDYREAARHYLAAHAVTPQSLLLYNAAYSFARSGRLRRALEVARRAQSADLPNAKLTARNDARIEGWSAIVRARLRAERIGEMETTEPRRTDSNWGVRETTGTIGAAVGALALGGVVVLDAQIARDVEERREAKRSGDRATYDRVTDRIERKQLAGRVMTVAGGTILAGGGALLIWGLLDEPNAGAALRPTFHVSPNHEFGIGVRAAF